MKNILFGLFALLYFSNPGIAKTFKPKPKPDTVLVGVYITSVHDVDFRQKEFAINLWLWLKYKNPDFDFLKNLEVPMAKSFQKSYSTLDTLEDGTIYILMKVECVMKGNWKISHFPFDHQKLRFYIENSMYDATKLVFKPDTIGKHFGDYFLMDWEKDSLVIKSDIKKYETAFGDPAMAKPHSEYSSLKVILSVHRQAWGLFFKLFLGMYIAFLIAWLCFFINTDRTEFRLSLSVGSIFAVVGNKYIIDSALPESNTYTLVDTLHALTLFYIFLVIASSIFTFKLNQEEKKEMAEKYNTLTGRILLAFYVALNAWFIFKSCFTEAAD